MGLPALPQRGAPGEPLGAGLNREHILSVLHDMAMVVGGEVRLRPLLTKALQRLLYHTSFPVGLLLLGPARRADGLVEARLEVVIGDWALTGQRGRTLALPAALVEGPAGLLEDPALLAELPGLAAHHAVGVRLPIDGEGVILLVGPRLPRADLPVVSVFQPVLANLARAIVLCRSHEAHAAALVAERDAARVGLARFRAAVDTAADLVFLVEPDTQRLVDFNRTAEDLLGLARGGAAGPGLAELAPELGRERLAGLYAGLLEGGGTATAEATFRRRDGIATPVELRFSVFCPPGEPPLVIAAARDLSERRRMEDQLRQAQKLDAIGRLAGGVAHDFNNLLTAILGGAEALLERLPPGDPSHEEAREIELAAQRAAALTRQLLLFSRKGRAEPTRLDLCATVAGMARMLGRLIGEDVELVTRAAGGPVAVLADAGKLEQVILNLAINARDAMAGGGRLVIEVSRASIGERDRAAHPGAAPGPYAVLAVCDTGVGMDEAVRSHLFEPFFTTKEVGKGTGLGLSTVYGIVQQAGGHLRVESAPGEGSRFEVWLPRVEEAGRPAAAARAPASAGGNEVVLLVEDERVVRDFAARVLRRAGYAVLEADDGVQAEALAGATPGRIDLLLSDLVMPRLGGVALADRLREARPGLRVLFQSGYTEQSGGQAAPGEAAAFLQKPYTSDALVRAVRGVLDQRAPAAP